jgi:hypothetical protein
MNPSTIELVGAILFGVALLHTFSTGLFEQLAHRFARHAGVWHLLGEVEVVFGFWSIVLFAAIAVLQNLDAAVHYLDTRSFTEPLFVFAIMVIAASKPILTLVSTVVDWLAQRMPLPLAVAYFFLCLFLLPLCGSLITEPAAMTLAALMMRDRFFSAGISERLKYAALGVLFVNVSIGGTLTHFAAPPVLMVAHTWGFDTPFMSATFGWKAALAVLVNAAGLTVAFRRELTALSQAEPAPSEPMPAGIILVHLLLLSGVVVFAHHPPLFLGILLLFMGVARAYERYQNPLVLRESLLVAFFLAGLVVLGGLQQWWLQDILTRLSPTALFFGATALTAITDNAALTYLGSLVDGVDDAFKYALVAGAVTGGGLTVIANAPNPAGYSILRKTFADESIAAGGLLLAALPPTLVAVLAFQLL